MDAFSRALAGMGWTFFKTKKNPSPDSAAPAKSVFLFRKVDSGRVRALRDNDGTKSISKKKEKERKEKRERKEMGNINHENDEDLNFGTIMYVCRVIEQDRAGMI
ncbi:hypothetical protein JRO89_XS08G0257200 [Xanthoceras sorbifolium]|uniref:Uncharacterized protein n=1 Tax=Xanthoceras sorbifolium TaxID=99658 RepID=A0ABQ8HRJ0_9ROSI|nr:hypothetical protein JRO89_XS08G0257200 [Xanthoceras sorbifolium]